jgi:hypothetical protein
LKAARHRRRGCDSGPPPGRHDGVRRKLPQELIGSSKISHAATVHEIEGNPDSEHVKALHVLLIEARDLAAHYRGRDNILAHIDHFQNGAAKPEKFYHDLYGLTSVYELVAETLTNRDFQYLLLDLDNNVRTKLDSDHPLHLLTAETNPTGLVTQAVNAFAAIAPYWRAKRLAQDITYYGAEVMKDQASRVDCETASGIAAKEAA